MSKTLSQALAEARVVVITKGQIPLPKSSEPFQIECRRLGAKAYHLPPHGGTGNLWDKSANRFVGVSDDLVIVFDTKVERDGCMGELAFCFTALHDDRTITFEMAQAIRVFTAEDEQRAKEIFTAANK